MKDWVIVRITRKTRRRLDALRDLALEMREQGRVEIEDSGKPGSGPPTVDAVINLLLDRDEKHRARARKQANKRKGYTEDPAIAVADEPALVVVGAGSRVRYRPSGSGSRGLGSLSLVRGEVYRIAMIELVDDSQFVYLQNEPWRYPLADFERVD